MDQGLLSRHTDQLGLDRAGIALRTLPLGTNPIRYRQGIEPRAVQEKYRLPAGQCLLTVASLSAHKGTDTELRALVLLRHEVPDLCYPVVGWGFQERELAALAHELGVEDRVRFLADVPEADLPALYNMATDYVGVSRSTELMGEGFVTSLVEALVFDIRVIGRVSGCVPGGVRDGETGLLGDPDRPESVRDAVLRLLLDRELAARLGAGGRRAVESFYNRDVAAAVTGIASKWGSPMIGASGVAGCACS